MRILRYVVGLCVVTAACSPMYSDDQVGVQTSVMPELRGPYLGQEPPGFEPRLFAPGVVSTGLATRDIAITPDGNELYFSVALGAKTMIMVTRQFGRTGVLSVDHRGRDPVLHQGGRGQGLQDLSLPPRRWRL